MATKGEDSGGGSVELNMTPMIDVVFLLLIFFILVNEMSKLDAADLTLPYAPIAMMVNEDPDPHKLIIVNIEKRASTPGVGKILIQGREHDLKSLKQFIHHEAIVAGMEDEEKRISHLRVRIRADFDARTKAIQRVLTACMDNKVYKTEVGASTSPDPLYPDALVEPKNR